MHIELNQQTIIHRAANTVILPILISAALLTGCSAIPPPDTLSSIRFADENIDEWRTRSFSGNTRYSVVSLDGERVLRATSKQSASAILKAVNIDLTATPYINWRWRIDNTHGDAINEQSKMGDDYPARLYVLASDGYQPWEVIAVNYVWSSNQAENSHWANAWSDKAQMLAVQSGDSTLGRWITEKRHMRDDFKMLFNREISAINAVAIMVDSDNAGGSATSYFGDIYFSAD